VPFGLEMHQAAWIIGGIFAGMSCCISFFLIFKHLRHYSEPKVQRYMVRIILLVPVYAIDSYVALLLKDYALYFNVVRDCYEAYVLYMFFRLLVELADGEENLSDQLEQVPQMKYSLPFCCFHIKPGRIFLHRCKQLILQFVVVKPFLAGITFILEITETYEEGNLSPKHGYLYITILYNLSITICLYFLVLFYEATKGILAPYKPISKFLCIKAVIFFSFWQGVTIAVLVAFDVLIKEREDWTVSEISTATQNFLICIEMFPCAIAYALTFGYRTFKNPESKQQLLSTAGASSLVKNFKDVADVQDVVIDTRSALRKDPNRKRVEEIDNFLKLQSEDQKYYTIHQGWIEKKGEDLVKNWKKRYLVAIKHPHGLAYFKMNPFQENPDTLIKARGWIPVASMTGIVPKTKAAFNVVSNARTFRFRCSSVQEKDQWVKVLQEQLPEFGAVQLE